MSDELRAYTYVGWNFASHQTVPHRPEIRGEVHTIYGVYQHVSEAP